MAYGTLAAIADATKSFAIDLINTQIFNRSKIAFGPEGVATDVSSGNPLPVAGTFFQAIQPITGTVAVSGAVPVTGTFFQATQPVSAVTLPLPTGAATAAGVAATASGDNWVAVTPNDGADLAVIPKALYIGGAGNIVVNGADGNAATFAVTAGQILPIRARRVRATSTTATGIVAIS